ncbi:MAG: hypothetical protein ACOX6D_02570 [Thermoguttaceae bacterium]|jgi:hypothetical protein
MLDFSKVQPSKREVNISEWDPGAKAFVKDLSGLEYVLFREYWNIYCNADLSADERAEGALNAFILAVVDAEGRPLTDVTQIGTMKNLSFRPVARVLAMLLDPDRQDDSLKNS